jgi:pilus assembly protein Flp/PilA
MFKSARLLDGAVSNMESYKMKKFLKDESGVTAIEYGVIAAAMGVALVVVMPSLAGKITTQFSNIGSHIASGK